MCRVVNFEHALNGSACLRRVEEPFKVIQRFVVTVDCYVQALLSMTHSGGGGGYSSNAHVASSAKVGLTEIATEDLNLSGG